MLLPRFRNATAVMIGALAPIGLFAAYVTSAQAPGTESAARDVDAALMVPQAIVGSLAVDGGGASPAAPGPGTRSMALGDGRVYPIRPLHELAPDAERFLAARDPQWGFAVVLPGRGMAYSVNGDEQFALASLTKVVILLAILDLAEREEREPAEDEFGLMAAMIEFSDNESAAILWELLGGGEAIAAFLEREGVTGVYPAPPGRGWGDSTATANGLALLLTKVVIGTFLTDASRAIVTGLMAAVAEEQRWGVSAGFPAAQTPVSIKDGWYPALSGWRVTSAGFSSDEAVESMVMVALTRNQGSFEYAVETIQGAASLVGRAVYGEAVEAIDPGETTDLPPTETYRFAPPSEGLATLRGVCETPSGVARRSGAWRCTVDEAVFDPCFVPEASAGTVVVCGARPDGSGDPFILETGTPLGGAGEEDLRYPWVLLLDDGTECDRAVGFEADEDGDSVSYLCADGTTILGPLQQTGDWAALRLDPDTWATWTSRVTFAWY